MNRTKIFAAAPRLMVLIVAVWIGSTARAVDYNRDIRPILSENCFACHGFDEKSRKAKLRLDGAEFAHADRDGFTAFKPGDLANSEAWLRIISTDEDEVMPPADSHSKLTAAQKEKIKLWIEGGAKYSAHWAFVAPQKSPLPRIENSKSKIENPIDAFVQAQLVAQKLRPAPEADRRTLIRRLAFDLTGLPPSVAEVEAFAADRAPHAVERLVDRLLASPHFGERLALDWLDAARYADTNGFSIDGGRHLWLWRDWVIQAFNDNLPYDRFLATQLAGDLFPNRTESDQIATGFQRNNMVTHEGGTIPEENLTNYNADRVKTLGEAVLGLTLACAQCHDHKFDPITQKDYFRTFAFFNSLGDKGLDGNGGVNPGPFVRARTVLKTNDQPVLRARIAALEAKLAQPDPAVLGAWESRERARLAERGRDLQVLPVKVVKVSTPNASVLEIVGDDRVRVIRGGELAAFDILAELPKTARPITGLRVTMHPVAEFPLNGWGKGTRLKTSPLAAPGPAVPDPAEPVKKGTFKLTAIDASIGALPGDQVDVNKLETFARVTASSWEAEHPAVGCLDRRSDSGWSPDPATDGPVHLTATLAKPIGQGAGPYLNFQLGFGAGRALLPGLIQVAVVTGTDDGTDLPAAVVDALALAPATRPPEATATLWAQCAQQATELWRDRIELKNAREQLAALTEPFPTMVMAVAAAPRDTFILNRGDYAQPGEKVEVGTPAALPPMPAGAPQNRLGLAQWITMKENPLTARVAVNRIWKLFFGEGLVGTLADFGLQGDWPTHPELLDWLAVDFVESGWDVKRLVRLIVTSGTYRQSSAATAGQLETDPANQLLARGPRFRLPAEFVRDQALAVSGLLVPRLGGPSVNPYAPGDLWREVSHYGSTPATAQTFVQDHGEKLYRRSLYTYLKRTAPPPNMAAFDAPNREVCTVARSTTNTPLQALVTLNDPQFVEASRVLAERVLAQPGDDAARLRWAFGATVSRSPEAAEFGVIESALRRERQHYAKDTPAALALLAVGESPRNQRLRPAEHAAWTQVASLLFNLSETITRN
jgi:hypothetical protein